MATQIETPTARLYRATRGRVDVIEVPELRFAVVDGRGRPEGGDFAQAIQGLYTVAWGVRFALRGGVAEEKVSPLEALWWTTDGADKESWSWRAMIRLPMAASDDVVTSVKAQALERHPDLQHALDLVHVVQWHEGLSVQTLHVGPYADELPTVQLLHEFIAANGYAPTGRHHEIYLGDPRRCAPEKLRTILRQPVRSLEE